MTKERAVKEFQTLYHNLYEQKADYWTAQLAWSAFTDALCKEGRITQEQYNSWSTPFKYGKHLSCKKIIKYSN